MVLLQDKLCQTYLTAFPDRSVHVLGKIYAADVVCSA